MPPEDAGGLPAYAWAIILIAALSALAFLYYYIVPNCAALPVRGIYDHECGGEKMAVVYVCSAMFLGAAAFSLYRLAVAAVKGRNR